MNKLGKFKSNHIKVFGVKFCIPKGTRKKVNKTNPNLKGVKLDEKHLEKVLKPN